VVLIINTDHHASEFKLKPDFSSRLTGLLVRQNVGFDFAAWGHAFCLLPRGMIRRRLYFVNDSIVGPLDQAAYRTILERIRRSGADMIGLTQNTMPKPHLQSFFLVFNERLFRSQLFTNLMTNMINFPLKNAAIYRYEIQLTSYFQEHGFQCEALFPNMAQDNLLTNDTFYRWAQLIENGFPFIKGEVLRRASESADVNRLVPGKYR
jgi:lipopolysaccharide biosynthesis protein